MIVWKVRVRSICEQGEKKAPKKCYMSALVEAKNSSDALEAGEKHVEAMAPSDVRWLEFRALEAAALEFPILVEDL